jgi:tetratricopeptide (TPR) repeat protein
LLSLALAAPAARADRAPASDDPPHSDSFWRDVAEPHHDEVHSLLARCHRALEGLASADAPPPAATRRAISIELVNVLRYARGLEPDNLDVLRTLAEVADDAGDARQAREALQAIVKLVGEEHAGAEMLDRIGVAAIDAGRLDDAIRVLRIAQGPISSTTSHALVHLATALALAGHTADAIDALTGALPLAPAFEVDDFALVGFALAVQYDRDEQRGAAFDVLERMKVSLGDQLAPALQNALARMRFAPAEDERYYRALMDEVVGDVPEARTEWLLYAADDAAPYRRRALDHAHALDAQGPVRKAPLLIAPPQPQVVP